MSAFCGFCGQEFKHAAQAVSDPNQWWMSSDEGVPWLDLRSQRLNLEANRAIDELARDARSLMVAAIEAAQTVE